MSKSILLSIRPKWVCEIGNGNKDIEVRTKFPADYVGWVYMYCTKDSKYALTDDRETKGIKKFLCLSKKDFPKSSANNLNGKVVGRFWCDKVEEVEYKGSCYKVGTLANTNKVARMSCLDFYDLKNYLGTKNGYAIHISNLTIFDRPRELRTFNRKNPISYMKYECDFPSEYSQYIPLTKAPQNYCYIEEE